MGRGQLILIEGLDRSGKSTQAGILAQRIGNCKVLKFPDRSTRIGQIINEYLTDPSFTLPDESIHLLFSANRWELSQAILHDLSQGMSIVLDRYIYSGIAYSLAKSATTSKSRQMGDVDWLFSCDKGLPKPDLTLFLTLDLKTLDQREAFGAERYETVKFQGTVKAKFLRLLDPVRDPTIKLVDVDGKSIDEVTACLWDTIVRGNHHTPTEAPVAFLEDVRLT